MLHEEAKKLIIEQSANEEILAKLLIDKDWKEDFTASYKRMIANYGKEPVESHGKDTLGHHEAFLNEMVYNYLVEHPTILMDEEAFLLA